MEGTSKPIPGPILDHNIKTSQELWFWVTSMWDWLEIDWNSIKFLRKLYCQRNSRAGRQSLGQFLSCSQRKGCQTCRILRKDVLSNGLLRSDCGRRASPSGSRTLGSRWTATRIGSPRYSYSRDPGVWFTFLFPSGSSYCSYPFLFIAGFWAWWDRLLLL